MSTVLVESVQSLALKWPYALCLLAIPLGLFFWIKRYPGIRWSESIWLIAGLASIIVGLSRPTMQGLEPSPLDQIVLVIDSSASMRASDVQPSRIDIAKQLARSLIEEKPSSASVSLIGFAANASLLQAASQQVKPLEEAIDRISLQPGSALGSAMIMAIAQALPEAAIDVEHLTGGSSRRSSAGQSADNAPFNPGGGSERSRQEPFAQPPATVEVGSRNNAVVVLLVDGDSNIGPAPLDMASIARLWGLRIYCIGIGTREGAILRSDGLAARIRLEDKLLREIAMLTGAEYFSIEDPAALTKIFASLSGRIGLKKKKYIEVSQWFGLLGCLMVMFGALMSVSRKGRIL